ncbi:MAG: hypothetical protein AW09_002763 [Candidatus Accumulibacter phosphatis]|uniref:Uncharacterized protein n=1 Tax=Candidatus Accumulibacter phosphatis TaxID=327160 RepID=A0A080M4V6_9PROT|nr:MAG: hypothetical protein AW09_002763 [Candidatus Accumulibacter phosphatis]
MPPEFRQRRLRQGFAFPAAQHAGDFGLTAGDENDEFRLLVEGEANRVVSGGVTGVQSGDDVHPRGQLRRLDGVLDVQVQEGHARESESAGKAARVLDEFCARLDTVNVAIVPGAEEQIVEEEAEVGFARAVIDQRQDLATGDDLGEQRFDEMAEVMDLLELAPAVLVELAVAGQDVQRLEQFDRLPGPDFGDRRQAVS